MAHFFVNNVRPYPLIWSLVVVFLFLDATSYAAKIVTVEEFCNQTASPASPFAYCSNLLNSIPGGAKGADIDSLAQYTIEVLQSNLTNTANPLKSLIANSSTDPDLLDVYHVCFKELGDVRGGALSETDSMKRNLGRDYNFVKQGLDIIYDNLDSCMSRDEDPHREVHDPSLLPQYTGGILKVIDILGVISSYWFP